MLQGLLVRARALLADFAAGARLIETHLGIADWPAVFGGWILWLGSKLLAIFIAVILWIFRFLYALIVPKNDAPADLLKHYGAVVGVLIGLGALIWAGFQILYPPLVITVAKLPTQLESESWLNPELPRALLNQLERMRAVVKGERDPAFEAVLNPPNISIKAADWSLDVQQQILTPLGTLLGRGQGEVHLAVTCFHPSCARTTDPDCVLPNPRPAEAKTPERQYLCLRLTADIQRGKLQRRVTSRLTLSNDTYDIDMTRQLSRIAEAVTSTSDPATAALYFYRRIKQEGDPERDDLEILAELRGEAFKAAEQAETYDSVSACWAHSVRAHLAIDRREFSLAEGYISRAKNISVWDHLWHWTLPADCNRLIAIAEMELARKLARPKDFIAYPPHIADDDEKRLLAATDRIDALLRQNALAWAGFIRNRIDNADLQGALEYAQAEISLAWFSKAEQCGLLDRRWAPPGPEQEAVVVVDDNGASRLRKIRLEAWPIVGRSLDKLQQLAPERPLRPLTRQAAMDFLELFSANEVCSDDVQASARQMYLAHPSDPKVTHLFARMTEMAATAKSRNLRHPAGVPDRGNLMLGYAKSLYERLVDIAEDKIDVIALSRLAFITEAFHADNGDNDVPPFGPIPETLTNVTRAWKRYQQQLYPSDTRHHAEFLVSFWGALLLRFHPAHVDTDLVSGPDSSDAWHRGAKADFAEFNRALQVLFPNARPSKLAELPKLGGIMGTRIGCLCMLSYAVYRKELADFLIDRINMWQNETDLSDCRDDLIPEPDKVSYLFTNEAQESASRRAGDAEYRLGAAKSKSEALLSEADEVGQQEARSQELRARAAALQATIPELEKALAESKAQKEQTEHDAVAPKKNWDEKRVEIGKAAKTCRAQD